MINENLKILLVQLASNGDCLFVTAIAKQIKEVDYPGCHLTWMIGSPFRNVISGNSYIDAIIEIPISNIINPKPERDSIKEYISDLEKKYQFDKIFVTDYTHENLANWFGTTRSSLFRSYPHKLKVVEPHIHLSPEEVNHVEEFAEKFLLKNNSFNILFECSPQSTQSKMNFESAYNISKQIIRQFPAVKIILSSRNSFESHNLNIIDGSVITWKENAELTKYCHLLVGSSSGITWLNTSDWSKKLPMVQNIDPFYWGGKVVASVKIDFQYFGINTNKLIEIGNGDQQEMVECITTILKKGFTYAKKKFYVKENIYYGGPAFFKDVFKNGSYRKGNLSNLTLLIYLFGCDFKLEVNRSTNKVLRYQRKILKFLKERFLSNKK